MHLTAKIRPDCELLLTHAARYALWRRLRAAWPGALAACVMPNHLHLIAEAGEPAHARRNLALLLGCAFRRHGSHVWLAIPEPARILDRHHLRRQLRYVHLNPSRAGLVRDPLEWPWSTHRGVIGAEVDPWASAEILSARLGERRFGFPERFHEYVSGDPSAAVDATPFPAPTPRRTVATEPLAAIRRAALAATPWSRESVRLRTIVVLATHQGWTDANAIAEACAITPRAVRRLRSTPAPPAAAMLCLGDPRLQRGARPLRLRGCSDDALQVPPADPSAATPHG